MAETPKASMREFEFIEWIRTQTKLDPAVVPVGPGDDTAVVMCGNEKLMVTIDQLLDGVHFKLTECGPRAAGNKAMARSLSDVAAMAALPLGGVVSVALPKGTQRDQAEDVYSGLRKVGEKFRCPIVGGDVGVWPGPLAISVTIFARPAGIKPVLRSGAKVGDAICVTGTFGGAWKSQRHLKFIPRIHEARILASRHELHGMIDVSDGLAADLAHVCQMSGVGAEIMAGSIPIHPEAKGGEGDPTGLMAALSDGEDYELLFTLPAAQADELLRDQPLTVRVSKIGMIVQDKTMTLIRADGQREALTPMGWEHKA
ncbi:MAG: thiamine-phosphate kinase [Phycisphaerae bacterium]